MSFDAYKRYHQALDIQHTVEREFYEFNEKGGFKRLTASMARALCSVVNARAIYDPLYMEALKLNNTLKERSK
ncbi:hypothetical protein BRC2024_OFSGVTRC_CDS_0156 [Acinetobacter phage vB_AbaM_Rocket]